MLEPVGVGIIGLGTVGSGAYRLLVDSADHVARHAGRTVTVARVVVRDVHRPRAVPVPPGLLTTDLDAILSDGSISVAALLVGGLEPARSMMMALLESGKDVVTANKALLAEHGPELFEVARRRGRSIAFEAAVAGGIPIVAAIGECLAANRIETIRGILNGTSNFILSRMEEEGSDYHSVLRLAQEQGYAEADPAMDVDGTDATQKLALLTHLAFGTWVPWNQIPRCGIEGIDLDLMATARDLGYRIRLLATASRARAAGPGRVALRVAPTLVRVGTPLAETRGAFNAVSLVGDAVGRMFFHGLGAGQMPTASAVVADIIDTVVGRAAITFRTTGMLEPDLPAPRAAAPDVVERALLRFIVADRHGVLARIAGTLGERGISIASVIQREADDATGTVPLVIMTHRSPATAVAAAVAAIDRTDVVRGPSHCLAVVDD